MEHMLRGSRASVAAWTGSRVGTEAGNFPPSSSSFWVVILAHRSGTAGMPQAWPGLREADIPAQEVFSNPGHLSCKPHSGDSAIAFTHWKKFPSSNG